MCLDCGKWKCERMVLLRHKIADITRKSELKMNITDSGLLNTDFRKAYLLIQHFWNEGAASTDAKLIRSARCCPLKLR